MKRLTKRSIIIVSALVLVFILIGSFIIDLGINSKYFIRKSFGSAFMYRITGDCDAFAEYLSRDTEDWKKRCEEEKGQVKQEIRNFKVQNISYNFGSNRAFLQVELTRNKSDMTEYSYSVNYEMKKYGFTWKIDQELK